MHSDPRREQAAVWQRYERRRNWASLVTQTVKHLAAMQKTRVQSLGQEDLLEKEMATHSSTLVFQEKAGEAGWAARLGSWTDQEECQPVLRPDYPTMTREQ